MFNNFTEEARKVLIEAKNEMQNLKHPYVGSEHLLLAILKYNKEIKDKLRDYNLTYDKLKSQIIKIIGVGSKKNDYFLYTPLLKRIIETSMIDSRENNNGCVTVNHLFSAILEEGEGVAIRIMLGMNLDLDELYHHFTPKIINTKKGEKLIIDEIGVDLTKQAIENEIDPVVGRDDEIKRILEILSRRKKNNPILIGDAGVGKTAIVEELSRLISIGEVPRNLKNKRIISVDMASTVAGTKYRGEFEERIHKMLDELENNDNIILFIDEIHTIVGAGGAEGAIDASNIFKPALARNKMRLIGATTTEEYKKFIENDRALERRFQKVYIGEPKYDKLKEILLKIKKIYENYHHVLIKDDLIDLIIELSNKYIYDRKQPDKAIDILDEVCAHVSLKENKIMKKYNKLNQELKEIINLKKHSVLNNDFEMANNYKEKENKLMDSINRLELNLYDDIYLTQIKKEDIYKIVSTKTNIPIYAINKDNIKDIDNIKKKLNSIIFGQDNAIDEVINSYKQIKLGYKEDKCFSYLFVGNSGVGKTLLAKKFAHLVSKNVIKLDMSEYSESHAVSKLIGSPAGYVGYNDSNYIFDKIKYNPFSVIILDEFDKAHDNIKNLFFQILDDGVLTDAKGDIINFRNTIIIMTTNVGFEQKEIGFKTEISDKKIKDLFGISFVNRIDKLIMFDDITKKSINKILKYNINKLRNKYKDIKIKVYKNAIDEIIEMSNYKEYGARRISKIIKQEIEEIIINNVIKDKKNVCINNIYSKKTVKV